jgi:ribonucleoside-diphosphate reductase alpha chain
MQAAFQEFTDSAVSKTVNMSNSATVDDVKKAYLLAYDLGCKGITVYRDGSRQEQVMNVGVSEKKDAKKEIVPMEAAGPVVLQPRLRPDVIVGTTQKINTPYGMLYVTINQDEKGLFEVFATIGRSGGYTTSFTEAIARLISLSLRSGIPVEEIINQLEGIRSPKVTHDHGERILSVPDALAKALKRQVSGELHKSIQIRMDHYAQAALSGKKEPEPDRLVENDSEEHLEESETEIVRRGLSPECPQCGMGLSYQEGCVVCHHCGFSEC